jgi:two-component system phosphate regulon response regulator PhoB
MTKILIVEDESFLSEMYKLKFELEGYEVATAANGEEGLMQAKILKPDIILLDLMMPVMDGFEALKRLKADPETASIRVFVLSNLGQDIEVTQSADLGAEGFFVKASLTPTQLAAQIEAVISGKPVRKTSLPSVAALKMAGNVELAGPDVSHSSVLLIEDQEAIAEMYAMRLRQDGFSVELALNGAWGLKVAKERRFDAIIMDMVMPAMNGYVMLLGIRADSANRETPIIVLSNSAQDQDIDDALKAGANSYLLKSKTTPSVLCDILRRELSRARPAAADQA